MNKAGFGEIGIVCILCALFSAAHADVVLIEGAFRRGPDNCVPFGGWQQSQTRYMGFVYQNVPAFDLTPGDHIAFDLGAANDQPIVVDIALATTSTNGGLQENANGFVTVVSGGTAVDPDGDAVHGNYELAFPVQTSFSFAGGGLIVRFKPAGTFVSDGDCTQVLMWADRSDPSGFFVSRFYEDSDGVYPWIGRDDNYIGNMRIEILSSCGNGIIDANEMCDDGDRDAGDGCSSSCRLEPCHACTGEPSVCTPSPDLTPCDDGVFCNGDDTCANGACTAHAGDPCTASIECSGACNEAYDNCFLPSGTPCTDDGNGCTSDLCDGAGACAHPNNNFVACSDGLFCNGSDLCLDGSCSYHFSAPCAGQICNDLCDEATVQCLPSTSGSACFEDGNECTSDQCNGLGSCTHSTIPDCSTRTPTATRTRTTTRTPSRTFTVTPTASITPTPTVTLTPRDTATPPPQPAPASLVLRRVRLKANVSERPGIVNGVASIRAVVDANSPFDRIEEIGTNGVAVRIAGGGGIEMTLSWPAMSCQVGSSDQGPRISCDTTTEGGRRKLRLRPTTTPNVYSLRVVAKHLNIPGPRSGAPVRVVLITESFARQDDIFACTVSGAQSQVSLCSETGIVATPTPAPPLGDRFFSVARPGSALLSSIVGGLDVSVDPFLSTTLHLRAGAPDVDGVAPLELADDTIVGLKIINGQTLCMKIYAAGSHGRIDCDGGSPMDTLTTWDSDGAGPPPGGYVIDGGLGLDGGPGGANLFAGWAAYLLGSGSTIGECLDLSYFTPGRLDSFTTATSTGSFINPVQGGSVTVTAQGQNFNCATWTQQDGVGRLLTPLLATDTIVGDTVNMLVLADAPSTQLPQVPTPTPTPTSTPI